MSAEEMRKIITLVENANSQSLSDNIELNEGLGEKLNPFNWFRVVRDIALYIFYSPTLLFMVFIMAASSPGGFGIVDSIKSLFGKKLKPLSLGPNFQPGPIPNSFVINKPNDPYNIMDSYIASHFGQDPRTVPMLNQWQALQDQLNNPTDERFRQFGREISAALTEEIENYVREVANVALPLYKAGKITLDDIQQAANEFISLSRSRPEIQPYINQINQVVDQIEKETPPTL